MDDKRNALIDITRVVAAVGIILSHVDLTSYGKMGALLNQFLSVRFSLMFFLAVIGFYLEKSYQKGNKPALKRVYSLARVYFAWSVVYLILSFVMLVVIQKMPILQYLTSRIKGFFFTGSYYHFWFYPAVIYSVLLIGLTKRLLGNRALNLLLPLAVVLYAVGLIGTGYYPIGDQIPYLQSFYRAKDFEGIMHLAFLGFPGVVFGMAAARGEGKCSGRILAVSAAAYIAESIILCLVLDWRRDPQMLITAPVLTYVFLKWSKNKTCKLKGINPSLLRTISAGMYNVHPLFLAGFSVALTDLGGVLAFVACTAMSVVFGLALYGMRKVKPVSWFL